VISSTTDITGKISHKGFTLIEVLIALAVIAISLGAVLSTSGSQARQATYLKQKTIAHWVAMNEITKLQVEKTFPDLGDEKGSTEMANHEWFWTRTTKELAITKQVREVSFQIYADKQRENKLIQLMGNVKNAPNN
jgi:general secretion pathway protein I